MFTVWGSKKKIEEKHKLPMLCLYLLFDGDKEGRDSWDSQGSQYNIISGSERILKLLKEASDLLSVDVDKIK